ncbi:hypothetical protein GCM10027590_52690 [Nocardiopsis nanhaiensis]
MPIQYGRPPPSTLTYGPSPVTRGAVATVLAVHVRVSTFRLVTGEIAAATAFTTTRTARRDA